MKLFESKGTETIERNLLRPYELLYPRAVEMVATVLRGKFESGKLRGWTSADGDLPRNRRDPMTVLRDECARRYITTPARALGVLNVSPSVQARSIEGPPLVEPWRWDMWGGQSLLGAAETAMALDVLHFARTQGWSKPQRGEAPAFKPARKAARKAVRS